MKVRVAAFKLLLEAARIDGRMGRQEYAELDHFHEALEIDDEELRRETQTPVTHRVIEGGRDEVREVVRAMVQVAVSDGKLSHKERRWIRRVARGLGLGWVEASNLVRAESRQNGARVALMSPMRAGVLATGLAAVLYGVTRGAESKASAPSPSALAAQLEGGVVLLETRFTLRKAGEAPVTKTIHGTGFFVSEDGLVVTNKHNVEPWKFMRDTSFLIADGYRVAPGDSRTSAWRPGDVIGSQPTGRFSTTSATLEVLGVGADRWRSTSVTLKGRTKKVRRHATGSGDVALLRATVSAPVPFIPLAPTSEEAGPLDEVVVLGYPRGLKTLEMGVVSPTASRGAVGRREFPSLWLDGAVRPGNSGGPIIDLDGRAVAVACAKFPGDEGLGRAVCCEEALALIERAERREGR